MDASQPMDMPQVTGGWAFGRFKECHMYDRILIPLDGSALAEAALAVARRIPTRLTYLLRVEQDAPQVNHYISPGGQETHKRIVFSDGDEYLRRVAGTFRAEGREVEVLQSWGHAADRIVEAAADVDLIVMATHGRGAAGRMLHGSIADRVAREASAPVLVVSSGSLPDVPMITRILVPLDGSELAESAMPTAIALANHLDLQVHAVCVVDPAAAERGGKIGAGVSEPARRSPTLAEHAARIYLADCIQRHDDAGATTFEVRSGGAVSELQKVIEPGDLVVMTTHGHRGLRRLVLGSVADGLVRHAGAPVLLLRTDLVNRKDIVTRARAEG